MYSRVLRWSCGLWVALTGVAAGTKIDLTRVTPVAADEAIPIQDFFRPSQWRQPKLNPAGTYLAGLAQSASNTYELVIYDLAAKKSHVVGGVGDKDVYQFSWLDDHRLVFMLSTEKLYGLGMFAVDVDRPTEPYPLLQYTGATLVGVPRADRLAPLVWLRHQVLADGQDGGVAVVNSGIRTGFFVDLASTMTNGRDLTSIRDNNEKHILKTYPVPPIGIGLHYMTDREGQLAFASTADEGKLRLYRWTADRTWQECPIDLETTSLVAAGDKPDEVVALVPGATGTPYVLRFVNAATGEPSDVILADKEYDFDGSVYREPGSRQIVGVTYQRNGPRTVWFDDGFKKIQALLDGYFPGQVVRIIGNNEQGTRFLVATFSDRHPTAYHLFDLEKRAGTLITSSAPWIDPARTRPMQILKFTTNDGHPLDAYVTLPKGASKKNPVPLVVLPHGGPWVRDTWGYEGEAQFLASRGYAVLQPNYRGSPGYDWMFPEEDQWAFRKMHDDVTAATRKLLETGVIDPSRVAIMGSSFGAYLALSGVAHEPALYRCAVTIAGVFDWATVLQSHKYDQYTDFRYGRLLRKLGDPKKQADKFAEISPIRHVENVRVPVFVAHGTEDSIASVTESRRLIDELKKHNVPYEKLIVSGEGHGMAHLSNEVELYGRIEAFLAKHLAAPAATEAAPKPATQP